MPTFEFKSPSGQTVTVEGPEGATAEQALEIAKQKEPGLFAETGAAPTNAASSFFDRIRRTGGSLATKGVQGLTFGYSPEIAGVLRENFGPEGATYQEGFDLERQRISNAEKQLGSVGSAAAEIFGAMSVPGLGAAARWVGRGATMPQQMVRSAAVGAPLGAAHASSGGGDLEDRAGRAAIGAVEGGILGAALPPLVSAAATVASAAGRAGSWVRASLFGDPAQREATRRLRQAFEDDGINANDAAQRLSRWAATGSKPEVLADLGGENVRSLVAASTRMPGPQKQAAQELVSQRRSGQSTRIADDLDVLSPNRDFYREIDILDAAQQRAAPLYERAFAANRVVASPVIDSVLDTPHGREALKKAAEIMQTDGRRMGFADAELADQVSYLVAKGQMEQPKGGVAAGLNLRTLDLVKQTLWDVAQSKRAPDDFGRMVDTTASRAIKRRWRDLVDALDEADVTAATGPNSVNPQGGLYRQARQVFAGPAEGKEALAAGRRALGDDAEVTARTVAEMSPGEQELFRAGLRRAIMDRVTGVRSPIPGSTNLTGADAVNRVLETEQVRNRVAAAFPGRAAFERFQAQMGREADMASLENAISPRTGSQTTPLQWEGANRAIDLTRAVVSGDPLAIAGAGVRALTRSGKLSPDVAERVGRTALQPASQNAVNDLLRELANPATNPARRAAIVNELRLIGVASEGPGVRRFNEGLGAQ